MRILHLYPDLMNLYGDYGNITVLKRHLEDQGVKVTVDKKDIDEVIDFSKYDFIYMGSGTENNQKLALDSFKKYENMFKIYLNKGGVALFTGNAMEILGYRDDDHKGLNIVDFETISSDKRLTGDVIVYNKEIGDVLGFINKSTYIIGGEDNRLFEYKFKDNNLVDNMYEGYRYHNLFGTHIIGPVLVKNPNFMRLIVKLIMKDDYQEIRYENEEKAYQTNLNGLSKRI